MYQQTTIAGRLGADPILRTIPSGKQVTNFSVAVDDGYGENKTTTWFKVSAWGKLAGPCHQYLTKGKAALVVGRIAASHYVDKNGEVKDSLDLTAHTVKFLDGAKQGEMVVATDSGGMVDESEIPF